MQKAAQDAHYTNMNKLSPARVPVQDINLTTLAGVELTADRRVGTTGVSAREYKQLLVVRAQTA